ncbi:hypothetical protein WUBG_16673 [Wuchereria bancrofti]|uniref:Uncharacterized protein n=1 Tax=Wuchereria bancrofti TaxID=6293 RepID=J9E606_WUCBA|nr:hypothetical protein WUBG_16673 [Wuchereria bancrofti]
MQLLRIALFQSKNYFICRSHPVEAGLVRQDMDHIYTVGNVPTHQIVLIRKCMLCEAKFAAVRTFASTEKIKIMTAMQIKKGVTAAKAEFDNEIVWQIGVIFVQQ